MVFFVLFGCGILWNYVLVAGLGTPSGRSGHLGPEPLHAFLVKVLRVK